MQNVDPRDVIIALVIMAGIVAVAGVLVWRFGKSLQSTGRGQILVQCRDGHVFSTVWIPFASFNAIRIGPVRYQYCPIGKHWTFITPVRG